MSDAKRLLEKATPLPWRRSGPGPEPDGDQVWLVGNGNRSQFIGWTDASSIAIVDFDLAAYAVNHLPDYEAAVDALERLLYELDRDRNGEFGEIRQATAKADEVLRRLREKVPA